jgi:hypothetical protein
MRRVFWGIGLGVLVCFATLGWLGVGLGLYVWVLGSRAGGNLVFVSACMVLFIHFCMEWWPFRRFCRWLNRDVA